MSEETLLEWRVTWLSLDGQRRKVFASEKEAREWAKYVTADWGPNAAAELACREIGPWQHVIHLRASSGSRQNDEAPAG